MKKKPAKDPKDMRYGYTTGACATAATKAALSALMTQQQQMESTIKLPIGEIVTFQMASCDISEDCAVAGTIKDAGDDPDATHGALIVSTVSWRDDDKIHLDGGKGVGRVTKPGLPVPVGEAAINPVPRQMLTEVARELLDKHGANRGVNVVISVPKGEVIAKETLNGRLGIVGGISILGTRGTVVPFSTSAYKASIVQAINVARANGCDHVVLTTGGRSEKYAMHLYPHLPEEAFIEMGDFVGFALKQSKNKGVSNISLVGMMGKFSKVAQGVMMVHSKSAPVDFGFLAQVAAEVGASGELLAEIKGANTASQVGDMMLENGYPAFFDKLCERCCESALQEVKGGIQLSTTLYTLKGEKLGRAEIDGTNKSRKSSKSEDKRESTDSKR